MHTKALICMSSHDRAECSFCGYGGCILAQNMNEPLIEQVPKIRCGTGLKPWYPDHKVVNDKIFIKLCKWDRSFTAFILGRSMDNRKGSGSLYIFIFLKASSKHACQPMHMIISNQKPRCLSIPSGTSININTKAFDQIVQDRKDQSVKVAMAELSMEGGEEKPSKRREIRESDVTLVRSPYVKVVVDNQDINMLWAKNSTVLWMEMTVAWWCFFRFAQYQQHIRFGHGFLT